MDLDGRTALVTGGSRGIGEATCVALAERGCGVAVNAYTDREGAEETAERCREAGVEASVHLFDISDFDEARDGVSAVEDDLGPVEILVNNAGVARFSSMEEFTREEWERSLGVNLDGVFNVSKHVFPGMLDRGFGRIVNVASTATRGSVSPGYAAAKTGVLGLTRFLAREGAPDVRVNAVSPGPTRTEMTEGRHAAMGEKMPLERVAEPGEMADAVLFMLRHDFVSGEVLEVNGGLR